MFLKKDKFEIKEFNQMRQALRQTERPTERTDAERAEKAPAGEEATASTSNISVAPVALARQVSESLLAHPDKCSSVVSTGSTWDGTLKIEGSVRIDGSLSGEIEARGTVHVSKGAEVDAKVRAAYLVVAGVFHGHAFCGERLEILPTGRVTGELTTKSLVVHEGSFLEGELRMSEAAQSAASTSANGAAKGVNGQARVIAKPVDAPKGAANGAAQAS